MSTFHPITLAEREHYYQYWSQTPCHSLDYTLPNIWGWQRYFQLSWFQGEKLAYIRQEHPGPFFWAPLGAWNDVDWEKEMNALSKEEKTFIRVPSFLLAIWQEKIPDRITVQEDRGQWEYLYRQSDLATLPGKNFHKKKNHYAGFIKQYGEPDYHPINDSIVEDVLALQDEWCQWHECEDSDSLKAENEAINQVLSHWQCFRGMCGGALYIDGRIAAFSIGEKLDEHNLGVHYEKGLMGYKGIYQAMNKTFAEHAGKGFSLLNRAQDLNEEGLRMAKMSYHPLDFLKKYTVLVR
ncbi:MAG: DUF2156 domain-containing protein [Desulfovibrio sp.]|nr:DUF2156 domain-containing protein [Desulfovibrio sp.]